MAAIHFLTRETWCSHGNFCPRDSFHAHRLLCLSIGSRCTPSTAPQAPASRRPSRSSPPGSCPTRRSRRPLPTPPPTPLPMPPAGPSNLRRTHTHTGKRALTHAETWHASRQKAGGAQLLGLCRAALSLRSLRAWAPLQLRVAPMLCVGDKKKKKNQGQKNWTKWIGLSLQSCSPPTEATLTLSLLSALQSDDCLLRSSETPTKWLRVCSSDPHPTPPREVAAPAYLRSAIARR